MKLHHKIANLFGYDCIKIKKNHLTLESHLINLFRLLGTDLVIDVGGNKGQYGSMLREIGYRGRIVSFEPVAHVFRELEQISGEDPDWKICNAALGDQSGELEINVAAATDFSSFMDVSEYGMDAYSERFSTTKKEKVQVLRLDDIIDDYVDDLNTARIHVKFDTQGFDHVAAEGAKHVLSRALSMQSEMAVQKIYENMPDYMESLQLFRSRGFEITGVYPVSRDRSSQILIEFDCVMRKLP